jgi:DNA-binding beta-propeller fold protein YncE/cytochrome c553
MNAKIFVAGLLASMTTGSAIAEWQWSLLPGKDKGRNIPQIEYKLAAINSFQQVLDEWEPVTNIGASVCAPDIKELKVLDTFPAGKQRVFPKKGQTLVYSLSSNRGHQSRLPGEDPTAKSTTITVVDAATKEIVATNELPVYMNGGIHDTIMSPDGRFLFAAGPAYSDYMAMKGGDKEKMAMMESFSQAGQNWQGEFYALMGGAGQSTMVKIDAMTLEPVQLIKFVGTVHHGSGMGRNYKNPNSLWIDVFQQDPDGAGFAIFDPDTLKVDCAMKYEALGKAQFFTQIHGTPVTSDYMMLQVTPVEPYVSAASVSMGDPLYLPPNFVVVVDVNTWTIQREIPTPPQIGGFTITDNNEEFMYNVSGGTDQLFKQDFKTGKLIWTARTGMGPYGVSLNHDHTEVWVADKGESVEYWGNTLTVIDNDSGKIKARVSLPGFGVDHVVMSPDGKEIWATSNAWGQTYVVDTETKRITKTINNSGRGSTHGVVFVRFDDGKTPKVIQDSHDYIERTPHLAQPYRTYKVKEVVASGSVAIKNVSDPILAGKILFQAADGCWICHGETGKGVIGPDIRGKGFDSIKAAIISRRDMVTWQTTRQLTDRELQAIGMWLEQQKPEGGTPE